MPVINKIKLPDNEDSYDIGVQAENIQGVLSIDNGGTGANDLEGIKGNLGIRDQIVQAYPINTATQLSSDWLSETDNGEALSPGIGTIYILLKATANNHYPANSLFRWSENSYIQVGAIGFSNISNQQIQEICI